jgi:uncharacterized protein
MKTTYFTTFLEELEPALKRLPYSHQLAFAASCCERAYPNYASFSEKESWGDVAALRSSLDAVWKVAITDYQGQVDWSLLLSRCKAATPDSDMFHPKTGAGSVLITAGQEAAFMVTLLLEFRGDRNPHHAVEIAKFARDTVDRQIQVIENIDPNDPKLKNRIAQHSLMLREFQRQQHDLSALAQINVMSGLAEFQRCALNPEYSNIGVKSRTSSPRLRS